VAGGATTAAACLISLEADIRRSIHLALGQSGR
jgi:hypothetical protein